MNNRAQLENTGYRFNSQYSPLLTGAAACLFHGWRNYLVHVLQPYYSELIQSPVFIDQSLLEQTHYLQNFPLQLYIARNSADKKMVPYLSPACCLHIYPRFQNQSLRTHQATMIYGPCARYESGVWSYPFRPTTFTMLELVVVGSSEFISALSQTLRSEVEQIFSNIQLDGTFKVATDAFFLPTAEGAQLMQKLKQSKKEYVVPVENEDVALASLNLHETHFTTAFGIQAGDSNAHSLCLAFGLERLTAYGLLHWGDTPSHWPQELQI